MIEPRCTKFSHCPATCDGYDRNCRNYDTSLCSIYYNQPVTNTVTLQLFEPKSKHHPPMLPKGKHQWKREDRWSLPVWLKKEGN
jgi:hypothetical protein